MGNGKRLFADGTAPTALKLIDTKTTSRGVVAHIYQPSGKPEYGFALENRPAGIFVAGVAHRPSDVVTTVRDATGAALKAIRATVPS